MDEPEIKISVSETNDLFTHDITAVLGEVRYPATPYHEAKKMAAWMPVSSELLEDAGWDRNTMTFRAESSFVGMVNNMLDRMLHPWNYSDARVLPVFDLFPRWGKVAAKVRSVRDGYREAKRRVSTARAALHGEIRDERDDW